MGASKASATVRRPSAKQPTRRDGHRAAVQARVAGAGSRTPATASRRSPHRLARQSLQTLRFDYPLEARLADLRSWLESHPEWWPDRCRGCAGAVYRCSDLVPPTLWCEAALLEAVRAEVDRPGSTRLGQYILAQLGVSATGGPPLEASAAPSARRRARWQASSLTSSSAPSRGLLGKGGRHRTPGSTPARSSRGGGFPREAPRQADSPGGV